jgi:dTDP-4-dehydrorhamnose 3,5-epimerase
VTLVETAVAGVSIHEVEPVFDQRGFFARVWDGEELKSRGLDCQMAQVSLAHNEVAGTLRGLHYQAEPLGEFKTVRCVAGAIFDVAVDLRENSSTRLAWVGVELSAANRRGLLIPKGCAHGYITLTDDAEVLYMISAPYAPQAQRGVRWDDPALGIQWPVSVRRISARDAAFPLIESARPQSL